MKKAPSWWLGALSFPANNPGDDLLSHRVSPAVPSALEGLTSEFGMGSGVSPPEMPPETFWCLEIEPRWRAPAHSPSSNLDILQTTMSILCARRRKGKIMAVKPHGRLVPVSSTLHSASTPGLSTSWSTRVLEGACAPGVLI